MSDLMRYAAELAGDARGARLPPVERWDPPYCGELDLVIRRDGVWVHEGTPIGRAPLVRLFSTVLRREGDRYFLVTPAEKLGVRVEDAPFLAVLMRVDGQGPSRRLIFTTNVGDEAAAGRDHTLLFRDIGDDESAPYLEIRNGLWARVARSVYYDIVSLGETEDGAFGVRSDGVWFPFGDAAAIFDGA